MFGQLHFFQLIPWNVPLQKQIMGTVQFFDDFKFAKVRRKYYIFYNEEFS